MAEQQKLSRTASLWAEMGSWGDQHGVSETGVLSNQLHKAWEARRGKAAVPPKTASFRSRAQQHSSAVLQRSFLINISQDYSSLPRVTKGACAFV